MTIACPLCLSAQTEAYFQDKTRSYLACSRCDLIFVPEKHHLDPCQEKQIYDLHQNSPEDLGYQQFLNKLLTPLTLKLPSAARGLDFGCGPGPAVKPMLESKGYSVSNYDVYYPSDEGALESHYDFITCTEAIEHFNQPRKELILMNSLLKPGGLLGFMTKRPTDKAAFAKWHYKNDLTHICFFSEDTFQWIADWLSYSLEFPGKDTAILQKQPC